MTISFKDFNKQVVELEEGAFSSGALKPTQAMLDAAKKIPSTGTVRGKDAKGVYTSKTQNGKEVSRVYEEEEITEEEMEESWYQKPSSHYGIRASGEYHGQHLSKKADDEHYEKQSPKMQDAINHHLRTGKSYKDSVAAAQKHVKEDLDEALKGNQGKLDVDHDGKIEKSDLKKLRSKKDQIVVNNGETVKENEGCGKKTFREFVESIEEARGDEYGWEVKAPKEKPTPTSRKVAGKAYGGAAQKDDDEEENNDTKETQPKRGRGRPAGSKSGARTAGNGKSYGGLAIHTLSLPTRK